ncbi:hypothetical protein ACQ86N_08920 [Puia sp. P3]|uniref:hypothetical protein n=1 Tax=Puia sp. P3 TaxID=3423952 RepID=UPI003D667207
MKRISSSRAERGSSRRSRLGRRAMARARAVRCCWPPERRGGFAVLEFLQLQHFEGGRQ